MSVLDSLLDGVSHFIGVMKIDRIRNAHSPVVKCCFLGERGFGVHTKFFCSSYIYGRCWSRIQMMPSWHLWKLSNMQITAAITERLWCIHLGFHGHWFWLDYCREDPAICICIIMQIRSAITEICWIHISGCLYWIPYWMVSVILLVSWKSNTTTWRIFTAWIGNQLVQNQITSFWWQHKPPIQGVCTWTWCWGCRFLCLPWFLHWYSWRQWARRL